MDSEETNALKFLNINFLSVQVSVKAQYVKKYNISLSDYIFTAIIVVEVTLKTLLIFKVVKTF